MQHERGEWPIQPPEHHNPEALDEVRKTPPTAAAACREPSFINHLVGQFSNYQHVIRVVAYCKRFAERCKHQLTPRAESTILTFDERKDTEATIIRLIQRQTYHDEYENLLKSLPVHAKSPIRWFHPFLSEDQLIRIGGRLGKATTPYESKHQILLPSSHHFVVLLVRYNHEKHLHAAPQLLLTLLRLRFWITGARNLARRVVRTCVTCCRARPKLLE